MRISYSISVTPKESEIIQAFHKKRVQSYLSDKSDTKLPKLANTIQEIVTAGLTHLKLQ